LAIRQKAVVITQDLDFSALMVQSGLNRPSIISLRLPNAKPKHVTKILLTILPQIEADLMDGVIVSVEETQYRVRKLPV